MYRYKNGNFKINILRMSTVELRKRLIEKIQKTENENLLLEAYRLLELENEDLEVYKLSDEQMNVVNEARQQIKNGQYLTNDQANKDIDEWLNK
jgi:replicative DNA helicase